MKTTILYLAFFTGMGFGTMMMAFGNPFGDYITVASVFLGLYLQLSLEHDCSDHEEVLSRSYFRDGDTGVMFNMGKKVKCGKCGKTRTA